MTYADENLVLAWDRQRKCGWVKPVNGIPAHPHLILAFTMTM